LVLDGSEAPLERADHAGGDPRRMPVHPHHRAERLEPEWIGEPPQHLRAAVLVGDGLDDHPPEARHPRRQPGRYASPMKRKISRTAATRGHARSLARTPPPGHAQPCLISTSSMRP